MIISPLGPNPRDISCIISGEPSQFLLKGSPAATRPAAARFQARAAAMAFCDEEGAAEQNDHPSVTVGEFQCHKPFLYYTHYYKVVPPR